MKKDKLLHLAVGIALGYFFGVLAAVVAGIGKEVYDLVRFEIAVRKGREPKNTPDLMDGVVTIAGGLLGMVIDIALFLQPWS